MTLKFRLIKTGIDAELTNVWRISSRVQYGLRSLCRQANVNQCEYQLENEKDNIHVIALPIANHISHPPTSGCLHAEIFHGSVGLYKPEVIVKRGEVCIAVTGFTREAVNASRLISMTSKVRQSSPPQH